MDTVLQQLQTYMRQPDAVPPARDGLEALCERYPWFAAPYAALFRAYGSELGIEESNRLRQRVALITGDPAAAMCSLGTGAAPALEIDEPETGRPDAAAETDLQTPAAEPQRQPDATDQLFDTYFASYGHTSPKEEALLERMIFNPQPDYASVLMQQEEEEALVQQSGDAEPQPAPEAPAEDIGDVARAMAKSKAPERPRAAGGDNTLLSESLAKIFIKQGRYDRAYEIISNLNLNYPEKSVYFADQLRFLRKLIRLTQASASADDNHGE